MYLDPKKIADDANHYGEGLVSLLTAIPTESGNALAAVIHRLDDPALAAAVATLINNLDGTKPPAA